MNEAHQLEPAVEPLYKVLGYLGEIIRLTQPTVRSVADHRLANGRYFALHQHELDGLPGVVRDTFDESGPVWLVVERLGTMEPPAIDPDLAIWLKAPNDPDERPLTRETVLITVDAAEKDRLIAAGQARAEDCAPALVPEGSAGIWSVRLRLALRADLAARVDGYIAGPWSAWARAERPRRRTIAIYQRLREMTALADTVGPTCEIVWGIGVARFRTAAQEIDLPVLERLVEIELVDGADGEIRIRPRMVGTLVNLSAFEQVSAEGARLAADSASHLIEMIEQGGEVTPFVRASFEPILDVMSAQLDPNGTYRTEPDVPRQGLPEAGDTLTVSDRWVIFARPRSDGFIMRDINRLKLATARSADSRCSLSGVAGMLVHSADDAKAGARRPLSSVIGHGIDIDPGPPAAVAEPGDLFFPLPTTPDQIEIVRQLELSDGLVVTGPRTADRASAIANVVCHHLALGLRVLVVSRTTDGLARLHEKLPRAIRELTVNLTASDREALEHAESAVSRLQSIVETLNQPDQIAQINQLERDIIVTRREICRIDEGVADIASRHLQSLSGRADMALEAVKTLVADGEAYAWFEDRPTRPLCKSDLLIPAVDIARDARLRLADQLTHIDDELPELSALPDVAKLIRLHEDLLQCARPAAGEGGDWVLASRAATVLGAEITDRLAADVEALVAAHRTIAEEPWLAPLSPLDKDADEDSPDLGVIVEFARDASFQLSRRAGFLTRPVEAPADAFARRDLIELLERLATGTKVFTPFGRRDKRLKPLVGSIMVAGFAPATRDDWAHVRDWLAWRRDLHALGARWRSLAAEIGAPALDVDSPQGFHALERIAKCVDVAIAAATLARRNVREICAAKLSMADGEIAALLGDARRLEAFGTAVRHTANRLAALRGELARLEELFSGAGGVATFVRRDVLSRIGRDDIEAREIESNWARIRAGISSLHRRREDFELIENVSRTMADAGAPTLARRIRSEPASRDGDPVLIADWANAWNWAALMRQMEGLGLHQRLRDLSAERRTVEARLRDLFETVIAARVQLGVAQNMSSAVRQALAVFTVTLRKMAATCSGPVAGRLRRAACEALEGCQDGVPCWIMPSWRVAEQLPARLGTFDLVVIDEASQSDLREITTMLRARKVLVAAEDPHGGVDGIDTAGVRNEPLERASLASIPITVRQLLLPGATLCDLAKVLFPERMIRLRNQLRRVDPMVRLSALPALPSPSRDEAADEAHSKNAAASRERRAMQPQTTACDSYEIEDEIARIAGKLALTRRTRSDQSRPIGERGMQVTMSEAERHARRRGATAEDRLALESPPLAPAAPDEPAPPGLAAPPDALAPAPRAPDHDIAATPTAEGEGEAAVLVASPPPADELGPSPTLPRALTRINAPPLTARWLARDVELRARGGFRRRKIAIAAVFALMAISVPVFWQLAPSRAPIPVSAAPAPATAHASAAAPHKVAEQFAPSRRLAALAAERDGSSSGPSDGSVAHAVLYQEDPLDPHGKRYTGSVTWRTDAGASSGQASTLAINCLIEVEGQMSIAMSLRRNDDEALPASHVIEMRFNLPDDELHSGVSTLKGIKMKTTEAKRGASLAGQIAKVTPKYFMVALSATDQDMKRNVQLLKDRSWFDIPIVYSSGNRAILAIEKGELGERAFKEAFAAWGQ
jgi:hypothetical protein